MESWLNFFHVLVIHIKVQCLLWNIKKIYIKYLSAAFGSAMITSVYSLVDMAMVGQYQGPDGTAALAVVASGFSTEWQSPRTCYYRHISWRIVQYYWRLHFCIYFWYGNFGCRTCNNSWFWDFVCSHGFTFLVQEKYASSPKTNWFFEKIEKNNGYWFPNIFCRYCNGDFDGTFQPSDYEIFR